MVDRGLWTRDWKRWNRNRKANFTANVDGYWLVLKDCGGGGYKVIYKLPYPHKEWHELPEVYRYARQAREVALDTINELNIHNGYGPLFST